MYIKWIVNAITTNFRNFVYAVLFAIRIYSNSVHCLPKEQEVLISFDVITVHLCL